MKLTRAIVAGLIGAVIVWIIVLVGGMISKRHADLCLLLGASITGSADVASWIAGAVGQLVLGAVSGIVYAAIFEWVTRRAGAVTGFVVGLAHVVVAGIATGFLPAQRLLDASIQPPAAFLEYRGLAALIAFIVAHLVFGTFVGAVYGRVLHAVVPSLAVWRDISGSS